MLNRQDSTYNRVETKSMLVLQHNPLTLFSNIPKELIFQTNYFLEFLDALKEAAAGEFTKLQNRLNHAKKNKELLKILLLQKDDVITPKGYAVKNITLLGCAICTDNPHISLLIRPYFLELAEGEKELNKQYEYYHAYFKEIQKQPDYIEYLKKNVYLYRWRYY